MGTLGTYLRETREARGIDLRDAAQQTRISLQYLKALEEEDFAKLPGEVFVKGFLKNYGKFLQLNDAELMAKYGELRPQKTAPLVSAAPSGEQPAVATEQKTAQKISIEPFVWAGGILIALILFFFIALPDRHSKKPQSTAKLLLSGQTLSAPTTTSNKPEKLYLEVTALDNTWLLIRTDTSPQKKAVLKKEETLTWSADERFQLSYGSAGALKLSLNGKELTVQEQKNAVVRDLIVTASGIVNKKIQPEYAKPKRQPTSSPQQARPSEQKPVVKPKQVQPSAEQPQHEQKVVTQAPAASTATQSSSPKSQQTTTQ